MLFGGPSKICLILLGSALLLSFFLQVKEIIRLLWTNEAPLCSFLSDIQCQGVGRKEGHSMFFLETVLVPPIKVRPPSKGGDSVCIFYFRDPLSLYLSFSLSISALIHKHLSCLYIGL